MKILYCINATYNSGGMEKMLMLKANYLINKGYEVVIVTTEQSGKNHFFPFSNKIKFIDLNINYNECNKLILPIRIFFKWRKKIIHKKRLTKVLQNEKSNIVISMFDYDFDFLYKIKDGSKKILEFHFSRYYKVYSSRNIILKIFQYFRTFQWKLISQKYDCFVVLTESDKKAWGSTQNIIVLPNAIENIPQEITNSNQKTVCSIGRISYEKGFDLLLKAWLIVHNKFPDWKLRITGGGDSSSLQQQINNYNLTENVLILPPTTNISSEYLRSSLFVLSSRHESFGLVIIEAMSFGLPIVSFACPCGPKEIIEDCFGTLVDPENIQQLADALIGWISDDIKRKTGGQAARISAQRFLKNNVMKRWEELFDSLLKQN